MNASQYGVSEGGHGPPEEWVPPAGGCEAAKAAATVVVEELDMPVGYLISRLNSILGISHKPLSWMGSKQPPPVRPDAILQSASHSFIALPLYPFPSTVRGSSVVRGAQSTEHRGGVNMVMRYSSLSFFHYYYFRHQTSTRTPGP